MKSKNALRPKLGLALGGGSARGLANIGVLRAFVENDIPIDCIAGTSAGAIVATLFAFGLPLKEIQKNGKGLTWYSLSGFPSSKLGLTSGQPTEKKMEKLIGKVDIKAANIQLAILATDIEKGKSFIFQKGSAPLAVRASSSIPGLFAPTEIGGIKYVDGGLLENVPVSALEAMDAEIKIGVNVVHWHSDRKVNNVLDVILNAMDILAARQEDDAARRMDLLIEPDLAAYSPSDFNKADALVDEGYRAAMAKMPEIKQLLQKKPKRKAKPTGFWDSVKEWLAG
jgi:NTE family protein